MSCCQRNRHADFSKRKRPFESVEDHYSHKGNTRTKVKVSHCTLLKFPAWPRGMHSILASLSALFKSGYLFIQSVPAKFKVSRPVLGDFAPPMEYILSWPNDTQSLGLIILVHLGPFGFVCRWAWWEYITLFFISGQTRTNLSTKTACKASNYLFFSPCSKTSKISFRLGAFFFKLSFIFTLFLLVDKHWTTYPDPVARCCDVTFFSVNH